MFTLPNTLRPFVGFAPAKKAVKAQPTAPAAAQPSVSPIVDQERAFTLSLAHLPVERQQQLIQKREWYKQLAERQGITEAENQANDFWKK